MSLGAASRLLLHPLALGYMAVLQSLSILCDMFMTRSGRVCNRCRSSQAGPGKAASQERSAG